MDEEQKSKLLETQISKKCPKCFVSIEKNDGCLQSVFWCSYIYNPRSQGSNHACKHYYVREVQPALFLTLYSNTDFAFQVSSFIAVVFEYVSRIPTHLL